MKDWILSRKYRISATTQWPDSSTTPAQNFSWTMAKVCISRVYCTTVQDGVDKSNLQLCFSPSTCYSRSQTPPSKREKGLGTLERFLGPVHHHMAAHAPIQIVQKVTWLLSLQNQESVPVSPDPFLVCAWWGLEEDCRQEDRPTQLVTLYSSKHWPKFAGTCRLRD